MTSEEAAKWLHFSNARARLHTDVVLIISPDGAAGLASCVVIETAGIKRAISCEHILRKDALYFIGPNRLKRDLIPDDAGPPFAKAEPLASCPRLDLALFKLPDDYLPRTGKNAYLLSQSDHVSEKRLKEHLGVALFLCGLWGKMAKMHQYPDGLVYLRAPLYSALGPLSEVSDTQIIGDFAERESLFVNERDFPELAGIQLTGGIRELHGISGSGLWARTGETMVLLGIILGRMNSSAEQHLVRATPVWMLKNWLLRA